MAFRVGITAPTGPLSPEALAEVEYCAGDLEHYESAVIVACSYLAMAGCAAQVEGFGVEWWVSTDYDFSCFMEGLPELLAALHRRERTELDLTTPGLDRVLAFAHSGGTWTITCFRSPPGGRAAAGTSVGHPEEMGHGDLVALVEGVARHFLAAVRVVRPELADGLGAMLAGVVSPGFEAGRGVTAPS